MSIVDNRIVKMGFDNKDFERKVNQTTKSLEKLDNAVALEDGASKCEQSCSAINAALHGLDIQAVNTFVNKSISTFTVWGSTVRNIVKDIANTAFGDLKILFTTIPNLIKTGGRNRAMNIESARFQLKGLGMDVDAIMEDANYAVQGTAYGLDQAAKAAAQFGASGIRAGDEMKTALRSVSGVAAMTNRDFDEISRIFTAVAGEGKVQTIRLEQLSSRGLGVYAKLAEAYGVTETKLREMVSKGQVDAKSFFKVMDTAFGEHATKANETYAGSLGNVKAALSRIGEKFETKKLDSFRRIFVSMIPVINSFKTELMPFIDGWNELFETWTSRIEKFFKKINEYQTKMKDGETILTRISKIALGLAQDFSNLLSAVRKGVIDGLQFSIENLDEAITRINDFYQKLRPSMETLTTISQILARMIRAGKNLLKVVSQIVGTLFDALTGSTGAGLLDAINGLAGAIAYFTSKLVLSESAIESLKKIFTGVISAGKLILRIINPIINLISGFIIGLTGIDVTPGIDGLLGLLSVIAEFITKLDNYIKNTGLFDNLSEFFLEIGKTIGNVLRNLIPILKTPVKYITNLISTVLKSLSGMMKGITGNGGEIIGNAEKFGYELIKIINSILNRILALIAKVGTWISDKFFSIFDKGLKKISDTAEKSSNGWETFFKTIKIGLFGISAGITAITSAIGAGLVIIIDRITKPLKGLGDIATGVGDALSGLGKRLAGDVFAKNFSSFGTMLLNLGKGFAFLAGSLVVLSLVDSKKLSSVKKILYEFIFIAGIGSLLLTAIKTFNLIGSVIEYFTVFVKKVKSFTSQLSSPFAKKKMTFSEFLSLMANSLLKFSLSIGILVKAYTDNKEGFIAAGIAITGFMILIAVFSSVISKTTKNIGDTKNISRLLVKIGNALLLFAFSIKIIVGGFKNIPIDNVWTIVSLLAGSVIGLIVMLYAATSIIQQLAELDLKTKQIKSIQKIIKNISSIALSMIPMAVALRIIASIGDIDLIVVSAAAIGVLFLAITGIIKSIDSLKSNGSKNFKKVNDIILSLGVLAVILGATIKKVSSVSWSSGTTAFMLMFGVIYYITKKLSRIDISQESIKTIKQLTKTILTLSVSTIPIAYALSIVGSVNSKGILLGAAAIVIIMGAISGMILLSKAINTGDSKKLKSISQMMLSAAAMVLIISLSLKTISGIESTNAIFGLLGIILLLMASIAGIVIIVSKLTTNMKPSEFKKKINSVSLMMLAMGTALGLMFLAMTPLTKNNWRSLLSIIPIIFIFMAGVYALFKAISKTEEMKLTMMLGVSAALMALGFGIAQMAIGMSILLDSFKNLNTVQAITATIAIGLIMVGLIALIKLASNMPKQAIAILAIISVIALAIGSAVRLIGAGIKDALTPIQQLLDFISLILQSIDKVIWLAANIDQVVYAAQTILDNFATLGDSIAATLSLIFDKAIGGFITKIKERIPDIVSAIKMIGAALWNTRGDISLIIIALGQILSVTIGAVIASIGSGALSGILFAIKNIILTIADEAEDFGKSLGNSLSLIFYSMANFFANEVPKIRDALGQMIKSIFTGAFKHALSGVSWVTGHVAWIIEKFDPDSDIAAAFRAIENWSRDNATAETTIPGLQEAKDKVEELRANLTTAGDTINDIKKIFTGDGDDQSIIDKVLSALGINSGDGSDNGSGDESGSISDKIKAWLEEQGLSNLFGDSDIASKFGMSTDSDNSVNKTMASLMSDIAGNTAATASNTDKIKNNTEEMTVSLDTGQVVGAIAPDMYDALGRIRTQKGRGN